MAGTTYQAMPQKTSERSEPGGVGFLRVPPELFALAKPLIVASQPD
jgi:hypothetical protein